MMVAGGTAWDLTAQLAQLALLGGGLALAPLLWVALRQRRGGAAGWMRALTWTTLFLTFDLVLVGATTRLTDSGLGCPDWPGCYGSISPLGARAHIDAAQAALPSGPVTHGKAWMEMLHRYMATAVGALITVLAAASWALRRRSDPPLSPWWATATLAWVCVQGGFGALTVTMKLYPAIVTLHLLLGLGLLALLTVQANAFGAEPVPLSRGLLAGVIGVAIISAVQIALGAWVSTNYAVLACTEVPLCQGRWWPPTDFANAFSVFRPLGQTADGGWLPFAALTAIHLSHRLFAVLVLSSLAWLAWRLRATGDPACRRFATGMAGVAGWQLATGLSNVVLDWPLVAAIGHTGGAAALVVLFAGLLSRAGPEPASRGARARAAPADTAPAGRGWARPLS